MTTFILESFAFNCFLWIISPILLPTALTGTNIARTAAPASAETPNSLYTNMIPNIA